jgi:hypothetical protein
MLKKRKEKKKIIDEERAWLVFECEEREREIRIEIKSVRFNQSE